VGCLERVVVTAPRDAIVAALGNAADVAAVQREIEAELVPFVTALAVASHDEYELADAVLTDVVTRKDAVVNMRKSATAPAYAGIRVVEGWFKPVVSALEKCETHLKKAMGAYRVEVARLEAEQRERAAQAAENGDAQALHAALTVATQAGTPLEGRATVSVRWAVKRIAADLVPHAVLAAFASANADEFAKWFEREYAADMRGDTEPACAGVVFERGAKIGAKR
jgi:hypothetical protein